MSIKSYLRQRWPKLLQTLVLPKALRNVPNYRLVRQLQARDIWPESGRYDNKSGLYNIPYFDVEVGVRGNDRIAQFGDITVKVETKNDCLIAREVLTREHGDYWFLYDLETPPGRDVVIWDIGANIGTAGVLPAGRKDVVAVYGYEPFCRTFACYTRTIALNPKVAPKIRPFNCGLAHKLGICGFKTELTEKNSDPELHLMNITWRELEKR